MNLTNENIIPPSSHLWDEAAILLKHWNLASLTAKGNARLLELAQMLTKMQAPPQHSLTFQNLSLFLLVENASSELMLSQMPANFEASLSESISNLAKGERRNKFLRFSMAAAAILAAALLTAPLLWKQDNSLPQAPLQNETAIAEVNEPANIITHADSSTSADAPESSIQSPITTSFSPSGKITGGINAKFAQPQIAVAAQIPANPEIVPIPMAELVVLAPSENLKGVNAAIMAMSTLSQAIDNIFETTETLSQYLNAPHTLDFSSHTTVAVATSPSFHEI